LKGWRDYVRSVVIVCRLGSDDEEVPEDLEELSAPFSNKDLDHLDASSDTNKERRTRSLTNDLEAYLCIGNQSLKK
jgi:hypothetical protein